jgi:hypothetical protein
MNFRRNNRVPTTSKSNDLICLHTRSPRRYPATGATSWSTQQQTRGSCRKWKMDHHRRPTLSSFNWNCFPSTNKLSPEFNGPHVRTPPVGDSFNRQMTGVVRVVDHLPLWRHRLIIPPFHSIVFERLSSTSRFIEFFEIWKFESAAHHFLLATPLASRIQIFSELSVRRTCSWHGCMVFLKLKNNNQNTHASFAYSNFFSF